MPPRIARSSVAMAAPKSAKNKSRKRNLDAYSIAGHQIKTTRTVAPHRLGESLDDEPRQKRRRTGSEDEDASEDDSAPRRKLPKSNGRGLGEDEDGVEEGEDSEGNEWRLGGLKEDDDDSDLDSDEAFGESDDDKFEGFTFRGSSTAGKRKPATERKQQLKVDKSGAHVNLDEAEEDQLEEEDEESDFGDDGVDLATMLDDEDEDKAEGAQKQPDDGNSGGESGSDDDDILSTESGSESEDEDDGKAEEERIARMRDRVDAMDAQNRPSTTAIPDEDGLLPMDDLYADIMAGLDPAEEKQHIVASKSKKNRKVKTLSAPLPKRQQDRLDREVASQKAKEQLDRWNDTIKHNRRAEFLTIPLTDPSRQDPVGKDKFVTANAPQGDLEVSIQRIMEESGMVTKPGEKAEDEEGQLVKAEELGTNHLPVEEVLRRRAQLKMARELLFREEIKAKRVAKIKSKSYRRVHRRERERQAEKDSMLMDPEGLDDAMDGDERERSDRKRAEMRMSTKHRDSKFGKSLHATNRTVWDEGARDGVNELARRQEDLRRRIVGQDIEEDEGSDVLSEPDSDGGAGDDEDEDGRTRRQLNRLRNEGRGIGQKGVGGMKFMRAAEDRLRARNVEDIERLRKEMAVADGEDVAEDSGVEDGLGRAIFGPRAKGGTNAAPKKVERLEFEERLDDDAAAADVEGGVGGHVVEPSPGKQKQALKSILKKPNGMPPGPLVMGGDRRDPALMKPADRSEAMSVSPWVMGGDVKKAKRDQQNTRAVNGDAVLLAPLTAGESGMRPSGKAESKAERNGYPDATADEDGPAANNVSAGKIDGRQTVSQTENRDDSDADEPATDPILSAQQQKSAYYRRAFAGSDVQVAFTAEKDADAAEEDEQEISTHMPGWGSWAGEGLSKSIRKANKKAAHNPLYKTKLPGGVRMEDRKDANLRSVIVSEKSERKGRKYLAPVLPHEFERKEQYEGSLRVPVGPEWTTKEVFQRNTRPRVVVKQGVVKPMKRPLSPQSSITCMLDFWSARKDVALYTK
ncbi:hypothetical protein LTR02_014393 [Friedmanniomyces endolithicus]|nr:hypothetical protein LTR03_006581 [Friedmanniomyces endolithicus]KAK0852081.1 hypothetical protein LTS02_012520 [Friedmanniomyces endolithicus]KAK0863174.1 hypothetical protein LTR87_016309 [Friedmanniomyces endolithicus]KAK0890888.1 hypothetical protein LTR02_014393 [Friedmanniomyces endolithicus]KAK0955034.1 hypothetical protein LTS01_023593 [Friedmanniomyces endolithicus]